MKEMLCNSVFFGVMVSILAYEIGMFLKKKWKLAIFNPLLVSIVVVIVFLAVFHIDYESYETGAHLLSYLLTPATVCLAIPLYEQLELLHHNLRAILAEMCIRDRCTVCHPDLWCQSRYLYKPVLHASSFLPLQANVCFLPAGSLILLPLRDTFYYRTDSQPQSSPRHGSYLPALSFQG